MSQISIPPAKAFQRVRITVDNRTVALFDWIPATEGVLDGPLVAVPVVRDALDMVLPGLDEEDC